MFKQLRDLFRRTEPEKEKLKHPFDDFPAWLNAREVDIQNSLSGATASSIEAIDGTLDHLAGVIDRMEKAEGAEKVHPRLRDISKKALPQFTKSMTQILSREPSGDPETFYATATDILKSALKAVKGQGKYLSSVYPDEMKEVRTTLRDLGKEVNTMTGAVARAREDRRHVEELRELHASLIRIRGEYAAASDQIEDYTRVLEEIGGAILEAGENLAALRLRPDYARGEEIQEELRRLDTQDEEVARQAASTRTTAIHVFRKAGKVAAKAGDATAAAGLDQVLDAYAAPDGADNLIDLIESLMPATLALIQQGDLALKNQEEISLFSDPDTLPAEVKETLRRKREIQEQRVALQEDYAALPGVIEEQHLTSRLSELGKEREAKAATRDRAENQRDILAASYAEESEKFSSGIDAFAGEELEVVVPDLEIP